jgi:hypothetical protein
MTLQQSFTANVAGVGCCTRIATGNVVVVFVRCPGASSASELRVKVPNRHLYHVIERSQLNGTVAQMSLPEGMP